MRSSMTVSIYCSSTSFFVRRERRRLATPVGASILLLISDDGHTYLVVIRLRPSTTPLIKLSPTANLSQTALVAAYGPFFELPGPGGRADQCMGHPSVEKSRKGQSADATSSHTPLALRHASSGRIPEGFSRAYHPCHDAGRQMTHHLWRRGRWPMLLSDIVLPPFQKVE
jgi:hypothetical protein